MGDRKKLMIVRPTMGQGGADRVTLILLQHLDRREFEISLVLMRKEGAYLSDIPVDIHVINCNSKNLWHFLFPLRSVIRREKPDILFSTCGGANMPLSVLTFLSPFRKWKAILSERNVLFHPGKNQIKRYVMIFTKALFYRFADVITAVSEGVKIELSKLLFLRQSDILVVDNPVIDASLNSLSAEPLSHPWFSKEREIPVILHVGRFVHQKDHTTLVKAFRILLNQKRARLFLLGDGPLKSKIESLVKELDIAKEVTFGGFDINPFKYMAACDVFVMSSIHEGMPGVLIQAMACGAPVVSTNCPTGPDELVSSENGFLVPVQDESALASGLLKMLNLLPEVRKSMGLAGQKSVTRFEVEKAIDSYVKAIRRAG